jgi:hypothetical protein
MHSTAHRAPTGTRTTSFGLRPHRSRAHVLILYRSFHAATNPLCKVGLGVNALHSVKVLRRHRVDANAYAVWKYDDIRTRLLAHPETTHCVLEAPWVPVAKMEKLLADFPEVHFIVRSHSQIGFLQVEAGAITILRELLELQDLTLNLSVAANSERLKNFLDASYGGHCLYLPNLYDLERVRRRRSKPHEHRVLRASSFGALRLLKNHTTAAAAALMLARERDCDLEFHVNNDGEHWGTGILHSLRAMFAGLPWAKLVEVPWTDWSKFRRIAGHMDIGFQLSATETFNVTTADAVAEGVPCVVSPSVEWAPKHWQVDNDRVEDAARVGGHLLSSPRAAREGLEHLERFVGHATTTWLDFLDHAPSRVTTAHAH